MPKGEKTGKLTKEQRQRIKERMFKEPVKKLAEEYNVHPSTICRYRSGEHWSEHGIR